MNIVFNINFDPKRSSEKETNRWILYYYLKHKYKLQQYSFFHSLNKNLYDSISEQHLVWYSFLRLHGPSPCLYKSVSGKYTFYIYYSYS